MCVKAEFLAKFWNNLHYLAIIMPVTGTVQNLLYKS